MRILAIFSMLAYLKESSGSHALGVSLQLWEEDCEIELQQQQPLYSLISFFFLDSSKFLAASRQTRFNIVLLGRFR
jgi:hypothetical protein